jgi:acetolactate synthase-like protein
MSDTVSRVGQVTEGGEDAALGPQQRRLRTLKKQLLSPSPTAGIFSGMYSFVFGGELNGSQHAGGMIARLFKAHGVKFVFCLSGGHISPILVGAKDEGIRVIDVRHEVNAVFAADAVARVSGIPGVAIVTAGPGVTNTITAVKNAEMAESPLVLIGGSSPVMLKGRGALQDINQRSVLEPIVKKCWTVTTVRDIVPALREAFQVAQSGTPGPVFVELPIDILYSYLFIASNAGLVEQTRKDKLLPEDMPRVIIPSEFKGKKLTTKGYLETLWANAPVFLSSKEKGTKDGTVLGAVSGGSGSSLSGWITEKVLQSYLRWQFADGLKVRDMSPLPIDFPISPPEDVEKCGSLLMESERPVLVLGSQAMLCVDKVEGLVQALRSMGVPTFLGGACRGLLGKNSPYHISQNRGAALKESDCVILAGAYADFRLQYGASLPNRGKIISINRNAEKLNLNSSIYWSPTLLSQGDPCHFLIELAQTINTNGKYSKWCGFLKEKQLKKDQLNKRKGDEPAVGRWNYKGGEPLVNPIKLLTEVDRLLPPNTILVADGGDFVGTAANVLKPTGPLAWLDPGAYGTLGVGAGFALGVKLAVPSAEVWVLWGDGALGYSIMEYDTFARHNIPVIGLCGNDACWGQIEREQTPWLGTPLSNVLEYSPYENIVKSLGGQGYCISSPKESIERVVRLAQEDAKNGKPVLINALLGRSNFREGSISV